MSQEPIDYAAVLEDLKKRRDKLDAAIAAVALIIGDPSAATFPMGAASDTAPVLKNDSFFNLTVPEAIRKYLAIMKTPQKATTIAKALKAGGIKSLSKNFPATVSTSLTRGDTFVNVGGEWGLASWYPSRKRDDTKGKIVREAQDEEEPAA